eukprot:TRINITY_DN2538_c0_g1_i1.p1 TRINITY_DN2538_c0_g1~~TRINITY_DN2538_c0_g1_i1.p1  ORF type:complete len:258 (+),score=113.22 TRINITY_DN2538_c0_g1_i1:53-826(+)
MANNNNSEATYKIVVVRHGESEWNLANKFCGWYDANLSENGVNEAIEAGKLLKREGYEFDIAYTSLLKRAIKTLFYIQDNLDLHWIPVVRDWRLNERMYGGLQGLNKAETAEKHGAEQVHIWRRSYDIPPPEMSQDNEMHPRNDPKYQDLSDEEVPSTECLKDTVNRFVPYFEENIAQSIREGKKVLIVAHGNSLRALVKYLDNVSDEEIPSLNIPTAVPLVYELDANLKPIKHYYLGDQDEVAAKAAAVANQAKSK